MSKVGIKFKVDVTKLQKEHFFKGAKGTYVDLVAFVDLDEQDQYGNNGGVKQDAEKLGKDAPFIGNAKVFWRDDAAPAQGSATQQQGADFDDSLDIPF